jgi:stage V sporulation protein B
MSSKIARGSFIVLIGFFIFRIGGFLYRFITAALLGPAGYGILGLTLPLQGILITIAAGGLPPAIAKYVAEYSAKGQDDMVKQVISTSTKLMIGLGLLFSILIFFLAEPLAVGFFHKPEAVFPFQMIALITPFSVIVGAFRGTFQGFYQMTNILITRVFEQIFMISMAVVLILAGFYVAGAVIGTAIGFMAASLVGYYIFRKGAWKDLSHIRTSTTLEEEMKIIKMVLIFSLPVVITGLAEIAIYDIGTFVIGRYMASQYVGYYNIASPIARLPLIISMSVAMSVLPATAEAIGLEDHVLLRTYVNQSFRYVTLLVLPLSLGTILFAYPIIHLLFPAYVAGAGALQILATGMLFFTIYTVSSSISQGLGRPYLPMVILVIGTIVELGLSIYLVPIYGINGAAVATSIAAFLIMVTLARKTLQLAKVNLPWGDFIRIIGAALVMASIFLLFPKTIPYFILAIILSPLIYGSALILFGGIKKSDINAIYKFGHKLGPLSGKVKKLADLLDRFAK